METEIFKEKYPFSNDFSHTIRNKNRCKKTMNGRMGEVQVWCMIYIGFTDFWQAPFISTVPDLLACLQSGHTSMAVSYFQSKKTNLLPSFVINHAYIKRTRDECWRSERDLYERQPTGKDQDIIERWTLIL